MKKIKFDVINDILENEDLSLEYNKLVEKGKHTVNKEKHFDSSQKQNKKKKFNKFNSKEYDRSV